MSSEIRFEPAGVEGLVARGTTLAAAAERLGATVVLECGGKGECTSCIVIVDENPLSLSSLTDAERRLLTEEQIVGSARLACQASVGEGDCVVHVPQPESAGGAADPSSARDRIRDSFTSLPIGEQVAAIVELEVKLAGDLLNAVVEGPVRIGSDFVGGLFNSIFGAPAEKKSEEAAEPPAAPVEEPARDEEFLDHE